MNRTILKKIDVLPNQQTILDSRSLPVITAADYQNRISSLFELGNDSYTHYLIYGDREHFSNLEYFTGYDPRFEEALLILEKGKTPSIIVGDEGCDYSTRIPYPINIVIYHAFSLPNQPRRFTTILRDLFKDIGLDSNSKVGVIGWKYFDKKDFNSENAQFDIPLFIYNELKSVCTKANILNATHLMIDNETGLRNNLDAKDCIFMEFAGTKSSRATLNVLQNLKEGISELEASANLNIDGYPLSVFPNINFGDNYYYALASPATNQYLKKGDIVGAGMAYRGSLCHKVGIFAIDDSIILSEKRRQNYNQLVNSYFLAMKVWYESISINTTGGEVVDNVENIIGSSFDFGIGLNLGHTIHTDEWTNTPFYNGSKEKLHSGMAIQCDFTASNKDKNIAVHAEDGILVANAELREKISELAPDAYQRIMARKEFMINVLGINIKEEVLPTSDMPGVIFPFFDDLKTVIAFQN